MTVMSNKQSTQFNLISRLNHAEQVELADGESVNISPFGKVGPFSPSQDPVSLPRGIVKQSLGDN